MITLQKYSLFLTVLQVPLHSYEKPTLKLPTSVKQAVTLSHQTLLTRLAADQKKVRLEGLLSPCSDREEYVNYPLCYELFVERY